MKKWMYLLLMVVLLLFVAVGCNKGQKPQPGPSSLGLNNDAKVADRYDLIVYGGEPEGVAAAVSAARNGMKTLLLSEGDDLGGLYTDGELNFIDVPETRKGQVLVEGIYKEFFDAVGGSGFDIPTARRAFYELVKKEENLTLRVRTRLEKPVMNGKQLTGVQVREDDKNQVTYSAPYLIDATADGDLAAAAGAPFTFAGEDIGEKDRQMGVTLVFGLKNLDWDKIVRHLTIDRAKGELGAGSTDMGAKGNIAWGYVREGYGYEPKDPNMRLRGFNMSRQADGTVLFNALIIFDVDALDPKSRAEGIRRGQEELKHIVPYLRKTCVGFEKAELAGTAKSLYVRESRHMNSEYMLTINDVLENRDQWDRIAVTNYPVDVQPTKTQRYGTVVGFPDQYAIGFRSLVPLQIDGLMVVGRAAGYRSMAAGSARIVPTGMACGQAAGAAAALAKAKALTPRALSQDRAAIAELQKKLTEQGARLEHVQTPEPVMSHWAYPGVRTLRALGLLDGGYENNYRLEDELSKNGYQNLMNSILRKTGFASDEKVLVNDNPPVRQVIGTVAREVGKRQGKTYANDHGAYLQALEEVGILTAELKPYFEEKEKRPQNAEVVMLMANFYRWLTEQPNARQLIAAE